MIFLPLYGVKVNLGSEMLV